MCRSPIAEEEVGTRLKPREVSRGTCFGCKILPGNRLWGSFSWDPVTLYSPFIASQIRAGRGYPSCCHRGLPKLADSSFLLLHCTSPPSLTSMWSPASGQQWGFLRCLYNELIYGHIKYCSLIIHLMNYKQMSGEGKQKGCWVLITFPCLPLGCLKCPNCSSKLNLAAQY